jgi:rhamnosyltransferase
LAHKDKKLLAGCVILYYPTNYLISNIESYIRHVDVLFVIDNSETMNKKLIDNLCQISPKIKYIQQNTNIGMASALNLAAKHAVEEEYEWLLTIDQDSSFFGDIFFDAWAKEQHKENVGLIAASYTNKYDQWQKEYSDQYNEIHYAITSGNIINLTIWKQINGFEDKLFIDEVDHDYCLKLRKSGYKILISRQKMMEHVIGKLYKTNGKDEIEKEALNLHTPIRYYYISRNVLYLCKKYFFIDFKFVSARFYYFLKTFTKIIFLYPYKGAYLKFFFAGIGDFTFSRYGKYKKS